MRVLQEVLAPGMQDAEETDIGAQMFGIGSHFSSVAALARNSRS